MKLIDYPEWIPIDEYFKLREEITKSLAKNKDVISIYQMGSINNPGISDLDIICVFRDNAFCDINLRNELNSRQKKILTHGLFAVKESDFLNSCKYNYISGLKHLFGKDFSNEFQDSIPETLKSQIALEYMLKLYVSLSVQMGLKTIKVRSFLLQAKAIKFDLELLGKSAGALYNDVEMLIEMRNNWFAKPFVIQDFTSFYVNFYRHLSEFLELELQVNALYLEKDIFKISKSLSIVKAHNLYFLQKGFVFPFYFGKFEHKIYNINYRFNSFEFHVPYITDFKQNEFIYERVRFAQKIEDTNRSHFPFFISLNTSLSVY